MDIWIIEDSEVKAMDDISTVYPKVYKRDPFSGIVREFQMNRIGSLALMYILDACPILVALNALIIN